MTLKFPTGLLFTDPRSNQRLAGARLSFYSSGTTSPTSVYQDAGLTTLWTQPIVADSNGNFPANIYFDPFTTVKAKVQLTDAFNNVLWTVDPYFIPFPLTQDTIGLRYDSSALGIVIPQTVSTPGLLVNNLPGNAAIRLVAGGTAAGQIQPIWEVNNLVTGTQTAVFSPISNKPGISSTPARWLSILSGGVTYYAPCFS